MQDNNDPRWETIHHALSAGQHVDELTPSFKALVGLSDFVADALHSDHGLIDDVTNVLTGRLYQPNFEDELSLQLQGAETETQLLEYLRRFRRRHMVIIAALDLLNKQDIETSLQHVSNLAVALINGTNKWLYDTFCLRFGTPVGDLGPQPLLILAMGKLGGNELNFSSDIDLIFCYPSNGDITSGRKPIEHQVFFTKLAQKIIYALNHITQLGQVFRVDMRLRPYGESGPLVMHLDAFEDYYQEQGREWERYAMVKARVLNGDTPYSQEVNKILKPFVYRRYLDYGALDALRNMKKLIKQEVRRRRLTDNIKLGAGGIREVEFIVQSFQLIKGGRLTELQTPSIISAMETIVEFELMSANDVAALRRAYLFLRKVEHCLQQFTDEQTQALPQDENRQGRLAEAMKFANYCELRQAISQHTQLINGHFQSLIGDDSSEHELTLDAEKNETFEDAWRLELTQEETQNLLSQVFSNADSQLMTRTLLDLKDTLSKRRPSPKAISVLADLVPMVLQVLHMNSMKLATTSAEPPVNHDVPIVLGRVVSIFAAISTRTTYLQLLFENLGALNQLVNLCHYSSWIATHLTRYPVLLDELLNPLHLYNPTPLSQYRDELRQVMLRVDPDDLETQMETLRQFKQIQQLKIAAADVTGVLPIMQISDHLTYLAEAIIEGATELAWQQITQKYGMPEDCSDENKRFAVLGYGKLGGIELGYGSDLDLVFIHNSASQGLSDGPKQIETNQFFVKLAQRIMHLFMTKTPSGQLYEVDMRLRPAGNAGLLVCHINGFKHYQRHEAWTWEHQALVRARVIYGHIALTDEIQHFRKAILSIPRKHKALSLEVAEMRHKMRKHLNKGNDEWLDVKQDTGAMADIEFLVQYWVLANSEKHPQICQWSDNIRILRTLTKASIIRSDTEVKLNEAYLDYRHHSHRLTLIERDNLIEKSQLLEHQQAVKNIWAEVFQTS